MTQLPLAGGDRLGGAAHVAHDQPDQQREAGERDRDERHDARHDLAAGPRRFPGEARNRVALRVGESP